MKPWEFEIGENTTYSGNNYHQSIKWSRNDGSSLTVEFAECTYDPHDFRDERWFEVRIYQIKPVEKTLEEKTLENKTPDVEKKKMKVWHKLFAKNKQVEKPEIKTVTSEVKTVASKEILFKESYGYNHGSSVEEFLQKPIQLAAEYEQIAHLIEKARKTIVEIGYPMLKEAMKKKKEEDKKKLEERNIKYEQEQSLKRTAVNNMIAEKIKGFDI